MNYCEHNFDKIWPGHGDLKDPMAVVDWIKDHRLQREKVILLNFSSVTSDDLVTRSMMMSTQLHPIAVWSLEAHLYKLLEDKVITLDTNQKIWSFIK